MSTMKEAVEHVLATREVAEKMAAAREEVREAIALALHKFIENFAGRDRDLLLGALQTVRATPLDVTPLADTIKDLRADAEQTAAVVRELEAALTATQKHASEMTSSAANALAELERVANTLADVAEVTMVVRAADQAFQTSGGSSRHWVAEQFLPRLEAAGLRIVKVSAPEKPAGASTPRPPAETQ